MLDLKKEEPNLVLCNPILTYHGPYTAILYAYLKYYVEKNDIQLTQNKFLPHYEFTLSRLETLRATGLTDGQQIDSELDFSGAFLADTYPIDRNKVRYEFYPQHEDNVRRWIYEQQEKWTIPTQ